MAIVERLLTTVPMIAAAAVVSCGTSASTSAWDDGGNVGTTGNGANGGPNGTGGGGANGSGSGSSSSSSGAGTGPGGGSGGSVFVAVGDGGSDGGAIGTGTGQACTALNAARSCCGSGTQTCTGVGEFLSWGPCIDGAHVALACDVPQPPCQTNENGQACDGGTDAAPPPPPPPIRPPPPPPICTDMIINTEPEILVAYSPALHQTVGQGGQIKVWVNDENPPFIAPGEQVDPHTGLITAPGNRTAKAPDGLVWEPALYIAPQTPQNGGTPHFPVAVKGWYDNTPPNGSKGFQVPGMDPVPAGSNLAEVYTAEDIWDVSSLGLAPGTYTAVFSVFDGDSDRGIACVTITITP